MRVLEIKELYNWYIDKYRMSDGTEVLRAHGIVTGHDRLRDTTFINTSQVLEVVVENNIAFIQTGNTRYECDLECAQYSLFDTPEIIQDFDSYKKKYANIQKSKKITLENNGVVITLGNNREFYFDSIYAKSQGEESYSNQVHPHIGMFQDSVACMIHTKGKIINYCYFPYQNLHVEFYSWMHEMETYIENCGDKALFVTVEHRVYKILPQERKKIVEENAEGAIFDLNYTDLYDVRDRL